jgi:hypothetical protein
MGNASPSPSPFTRGGGEFSPFTSLWGKKLPHPLIEEFPARNRGSGPHCHLLSYHTSSMHTSPWYVVIVLVAFQRLLKHLDDKLHLLIVEASRLNLRHLTWGDLVLIRCFQGNDLWFFGGDILLHQVFYVLRVPKHYLMVK